MAPSKLHRTILIIILISVHSEGSTYRWKKARGIRQGQERNQRQEFLKEIAEVMKPSLRKEENKRFKNEYRENPFFPFSKIVRSIEFKRSEMTREKSKPEDILTLHVFPFSIVKYGE